MGDNTNIAVELESIEAAVGTMTTKVVDEITSLRRDWASYLDQVKVDEWTLEEACLAFGNSYRSAIEAYDAVMQGMKTDIIRYRDELQATHDAYRNRDDAVMGEMNRRLAQLENTSAADDAGRTAYHDRPNLDDGSDTPPPAPPDTSPGPGN